MPDNVAVSAGTGTTIAADEVVDGTLGTVKVQYVKLMDGTLDGATKAAVGANGLAVDVKAIVPGTAATSLGKAEDAAHASGDVGVMMLAVRNDAGTALAGTTGDYIPFTTDASGNLLVNVASGGTSGTQYTEDVAAATDPIGNMLVAVRRDTLSVSEVSADGDNIALKATNKGQLHVFLEGMNPNSQATNANSAPVVISSEQTFGTSGSSQNKATPANIFAVGGQFNTTPTTVTNGNVTPIQMTFDGRVLTQDAAVLVDDAAFTPATSKVVAVGFLADETATDSVNEGDGGAARMTLDRKQIMTMQPHSAGGLSIFRSLDLDETEEEASAAPCCLYKLRITNRVTTARYVKIYNATAASVTVGTTTPVDTIIVPAAGSADLATVITESFGGQGLTLDTALCFAATTALADNDTGAPGANDVVLTAYYK